MTDFRKVTGCIVNIKSAKNDSAAGRGHRYYFAKSNPVKDKSSYCITWIIWRYVQHARPGPKCPFFHIPKLGWTLKPVLKLKNNCGNWRKCSVSTRAAYRHTRSGLAGPQLWPLPERANTTLNKKSDVFLDYARNTTQLFEVARRALTKRTFTIQSTMRLNPGFAKIIKKTVSQH